MRAVRRWGPAVAPVLAGVLLLIGAFFLHDIRRSSCEADGGHYERHGYGKRAHYECEGEQ